MVGYLFERQKKLRDAIAQHKATKPQGPVARARNAKPSGKTKLKKRIARLKKEGKARDL